MIKCNFYIIIFLLYWGEYEGWHFDMGLTNGQPLVQSKNTQNIIDFAYGYIEILVKVLKFRGLPTLKCIFTVSLQRIHWIHFRLTAIYDVIHNCCFSFRVLLSLINFTGTCHIDFFGTCYPLFDPESTLFSIK